MGAGKSSEIRTANESSTTSGVVLERRYNNIYKVRNVLLICLKDNNNNTDEKSQNWQKSIVELQYSINNIITFTDSDQCVEFIKSIDDNKACIIISGSLGQQLVPNLHDLSQLDTVLIFSGNKQDDEQWSKGLSKVKGIFTDVTSICEAIKQTVHQCERSAMSLSFIGSKKTFDQLDLPFIYTQIVKEGMLSSKYDEKHMKEFINYCRELFAGNDEELTRVKEFESKYRNETPIWWYSYDTFVSPMLNRALRMMNGDIIMRMGFFITDLHQQIEKLYQEQYKSESSSSAIFTVYYAQGMFKIDFEQLKLSQRGLMSFNNFLLTTKDSKKSLSSAQDFSTKGDLVGITFIIKVDPTQSSKPFASISTVSHSHTEDEILFSIQTIFRITDIKRLTANNRLQEVYLTVIGDSDKDLTALMTNIRQESFAENEGWYRLGAVLVKLRHFDQAEQVCQILLGQTNETSEKASLFFQLGSIKDRQEKYAEAVAAFEKSLDIYEKAPPTDRLELANIYFCLGIAYYKTSNYSKALSPYKEALKIREQLLPPDHADLGKCYEAISLVYSSMENYAAALPYLERELAIIQKTSPTNHTLLIKSFMNIGMVSFNVGDYPKSLSYYEKVLEIQLKTLPANHRDFAKTYNNMGAVHNSMTDYQKGLVCHEKALTIRQKTLPSNHPDFGTSYNNIGVTYENMQNYEKARSYFERAIIVGERTLPENHPILQVRRENLARVKECL
ncbi:hypothetical protein I4U23_022683 [Adineta vaga]|nr:hypothetical protein I4U23_022683 [Adineta vaga]